MDSDYVPCEGFLFKLKENNKEWKKLYVKLSGAEIVYYDGPHNALADKRQKDGVKQVVTAYPYNEFSGVNAPTGTPSYLIIETSHAKKIYCAKSQQERANWVDAIRKNGELAASSGQLKTGVKGKAGAGAAAKQAILNTGAGIFNRFRTRGSSDAAVGEEISPGRQGSGISGRDEISAGGRLSLVGRLSTASRPSVSVHRASSASIPDVYIPDEDLDDLMNELVETLGLKGPQAAAVLGLKPEAKRNMLKMNNIKSHEKAEKGGDDSEEPRRYVSKLKDGDPSLSELTESSVWLSTAPIRDLEAFIVAKGVDALIGVLATLCRHGFRGETDDAKVEGAMRCLKALVKTAPGIAAILAIDAACHSFASGGGSLLLSDQNSLVQPAVSVLSTLAIYSADGHRSVLAALEELYIFFAPAGEVVEAKASNAFSLLVDRLKQPRAMYHAAVLTLINAVVSGTGTCPDMGTRVKMREALADLGFIELTREIAVFDQEMHADLKELGGAAPGSSVDLGDVPLAGDYGLPNFPGPSFPTSRDRADSSISAMLTGAPKHAQELTTKLSSGASKAALETLLDALLQSSASLSTADEFWGALSVVASTAAAGEGSVSALAAKVSSSGGGSPTFAPNYPENAGGDDVATLGAELAAMRVELEGIAPKKKCDPSQPMRPLHWVRLPDTKVMGTIWVDAEASSGVGMDDARAGLDLEAVESVFGLGDARARNVSTVEGGRPPSASVSAAGGKPKRNEVLLFDTKRSNNVQIALSRIRLSDDAIKAALIDPVSTPLSPEQVNGLLGILPTPEELETIREYVGDRESLGRVEAFFLVLSDVDRLGPRLSALQASQQFQPGWESLADELRTVMTATEQVRSAPALTSILQRVLAIGNYLNGTSARGGAYGFKLADLGKLVQVKSADNKTTLLHYLAKFIAANSATAVDDLRAQLNALPEAKDIPMAEKKGELAKLISSYKAAQAQLDFATAKADGSDAMVPLLKAFCDDAKQKLDTLEADCTATEVKLKELATWLAEKAAATTADLFGPLAEFVKSLDKAHQDNVREAEAERRRAMAPKAGGGRRPTAGMPPSPFGPSGGDKNMMLEMQLKLAKRTEKAAEAGGAFNPSAIKQQQQQLLQKQLLQTSSGKSPGGGDADDDLASGTLFAQRRALAAREASKKALPIS